MNFVRNVKQFVIAIILAMFLFITSLAQAAVWYVDGSGSNGNGSSGSPFNNLHSALSNPNLIDFDEIWIAAGTYKRHATDRNLSFEITNKNLILRGGYVNNSGTWTHSPATATTILSGDIGTTGVDTDNSFTVLKLSYGSATNTGTRIEHLTIDKIGTVTHFSNLFDKIGQNRDSHPFF